MKTNTWIFVTGVAAALASANVPAHAAILSNGAQQNGLTAKALNPNALNPNALKANAITTNAAVGGGSSLGDLNGVRLEGAEPGR